MNNSSLLVNMHTEGVTGAVGRVLGIKLKDKIIADFNSQEYDKIILDFSKVEFVTSGFAKELFGGLYSAFNTNFKQVVSVRVDKENEALKSTIVRALATVIGQQQ